MNASRPSYPGRLALTVALVQLLVHPGVASDALAHQGVDDQIAALDRMLERRPERADWYEKRAELHRQHRDLEAARADYQRARALDPEMNTALLGLARISQDAGDLRHALRLIDEFLALEGAHAQAWLVRARVLVDLGRAPEAAIEYTRAIDHMVAHGRDPRPAHYLARARAQVAASDHDAALRGLDQGLRQLGQPVSLFLEALEIETATGRHQAALARIATRLRCARGHERAEWLLRRGQILVHMARPHQARATFAQGLAILDALPPHRRQTPAAARLGRALGHELEASPRAPSASQAAPDTSDAAISLPIAAMTRFAVSVRATARWLLAPELDPHSLPLCVR